METRQEEVERLVNVLAHEKARDLGCNVAEPEHFLLAMIEDRNYIGTRLLIGLDEMINFKSELINFFKDAPHIPSKAPTIKTSDRYKKIMENSRYSLDRCPNVAGDVQPGTDYILMACAKEEGSFTKKYFEEHNVSDDRYYEVLDIINSGLFDLDMVSQFLKTFLGKVCENPEKEREKLPYLLKMLDRGIEEYAEEKQSEECDETDVKIEDDIKVEDKTENQVKEIDEDESVIDQLDRLVNGDNKKTSKERASERNKAREYFLSDYGRDLTKLARENKIDPVIGRDKEINRLIEILSRRTKNNPVLTGEPGVGKTSIVEGLAQKIVNGDVPINLINKKIYSLDLTSLVAGTKYRGEFEERMTTLMDAIKESGNIIVFIDELHTIIGAGGQDNSMNASNILKPSLSRGEIQIIGSTTTKEYTRFIEKDLALERRFQLVKVEEPTEEETIQILEGIKQQYEEYHQVVYDDDVIPTIVKLSRRYIPEEVLPDKAIDILDEAGSVKKLMGLGIPKELKEIEKKIEELKQEKSSVS